MRGRVLPVAAWALVALGAWQAIAGAHVHGKAMLSQMLLHHAWAATLEDARHHEPWPWADTWPVRRLRAPAHGIDQIVLAGVGGNALAFGPGRWGTGLDGPGPEVLAGHRDTHFRFLENLRPGDLLVLDDPSGRSVPFRVSGARVVDENATDLVHLAPESMLLLITCYPFDSLRPGGALRLVVEAVREPG